MSVSPQELQPIARQDLAVGVPLPFAIYDRKGQLMAAAGQAVSSERQLQQLLQEGLYHNPRWASASISTTSTRPTRPMLDDTQPLGQRRRADKLRLDDNPEYFRLLFDGMEAADAFHVRLLGMHPRKSLIISAPAFEGKLAFVKEGQAVKFRGFYPLVVYTISTAVAKVCFQPYPYLHLNWPDPSHIEKVTLPVTRRVETELPCTVYTEATTPGQRNINGIIRKLSVAGADIMLSRQPPKGQRLILAFQLNVGRERCVFEIAIEVDRMKEEANGFDTGISFLDLSKEAYLGLYASIQETVASFGDTPLFARS